MKRLVLLTVLGTALLAAGAATAIATPEAIVGHSSAKQSAGPAVGTVSVKFQINKLAKSGLATKGIGFAVPTSHAQAMAPGPCQVLDLVLGPLHLDLLGLIVDLNQIHLQITADPAGGILGSLLCSLTNTTLPTP